MYMKVFRVHCQKKTAPARKICTSRLAGLLCFCNSAYCTLGLTSKLYVGISQIAMKIQICRLNKYKTQKWEIQFEIFENIANTLSAVEAITQLPLASQTMKKHLSGFVYGTLLGIKEYSITCSNIRFGLLSHLKIVDLFKSILHQGKRALF